MQLRAERNMRFHVAGEAFAIAEGETIHTENSHKYNVDEARLLLRAGGWTPLRDWSDEAGLFTLYLASRTKKSLQDRSEEHTSELQSLMRISYAVFCLKKKI